MGVKWEDAVCCKTEKKSGFAEENERASEGSEKWISTSRKGCWGHVSLFLPMQKHDIRVSEKCHNMGDCCGSLNLWDLDWSSYKLIFYVWSKWEKPLRSFTNQEPEASERTFCPLPKYAACACGGVGVLNLNHPVYPAAASITLTLSIKHYMKFCQKKKKKKMWAARCHPAAGRATHSHLPEKVESQHLCLNQLTIPTEWRRAPGRIKCAEPGLQNIVYITKY